MDGVDPLRLCGRQDLDASLRPLPFARCSKACLPGSSACSAGRSGDRPAAQRPRGATSPPLHFQARLRRTAGLFAVLRSLPLSSLRLARRPAPPPLWFWYLTHHPAICYSRIDVSTAVHRDVKTQSCPYMRSKRQPKRSETEVRRVRLTARVTLDAYDAIAEIQRRYRRRTGRALRLWEVLDAAIVAYAKRQGIEVGE